MPPYIRIMNLDTLTNRQLLELYSALMDKLRERSIVRSANNPVADYTETLVAKALGVRLQNNSKAGYDAIGADGTRYQIKGRRLTPENMNPQLSAIRNLAGNPFDVLAAVLFDKNLNVTCAALIPRSVVQLLGRYTAHTNSHTFHFRRAVLDAEGVRDVTEEVRIASLT